MYFLSSYKDERVTHGKAHPRPLDVLIVICYIQGRSKAKGWVAIAKLKKIEEGLFRFGCNLGQIVTYICRL